MPNSCPLLPSHAAAREAKGKSDAAFFAARSAGQAVATAHAPGHAIAAAMYAVRSAKSAGVSNEKDWQEKRIPRIIRSLVLE